MTIFRDVEKQLLHKLSELGQGGIDRLHTVETGMDALKQQVANYAAISPVGESLLSYTLALEAAITELHSYGATAYIELGLKLKAADTFSGAAGQVLLKSGGTGKENDPPSGGGG